MGSAWLADTVLIVHVVFVLFVVGGFALILAGAGRWGWVRNRAFSHRASSPRSCLSPSRPCSASPAR